MDCNPPPEKFVQEYTHCLRFEHPEWEVIKAAANERSRYRQQQALDPLDFDKSLASWSEGRGLLVRGQYPDAVDWLLEEYSQRTMEDVAVLEQATARRERQALGERALAMIDELYATVTASLEARTMADELSELLG